MVRMWLLFWTLALTTTLTSAQAPTISNCTLDCINNFCPNFLTTLDLTCFCETETSEIGACIATTCTAADLTVVETLGEQYCMLLILSKSKRLTLPVGTPANGTTVPSDVANVTSIALTSPRGTSSTPHTSVFASVNPSISTTTSGPLTSAGTSSVSSSPSTSSAPGNQGNSTG